MPLLIILIVGLVLFASIEAGIFPSPLARIHIVVKNGKMEIARGAIAPRARALAGDVLREGGVAAGFITVSGSGKVRFSRSVPGRIRQQLANVVLL